MAARLVDAQYTIQPAFSPSSLAPRHRRRGAKEDGLKAGCIVYCASTKRAAMDRKVYGSPFTMVMVFGQPEKERRTTDPGPAQVVVSSPPEMTPSGMLVIASGPGRS